MEDDNAVAVVAAVLTLATVMGQQQRSWTFDDVTDLWASWYTDVLPRKEKPDVAE